MNKRELEEELKRTSTGRKLLEETEFANPTNDMIGFAKEQCEIFPEDSYMGKYLRETLKMLQTEQCEMTTEEYRQRMIRAFQNANCDELIAVCVLPTEKEFEHLEWLLKKHYKKEPCEDAISREDVIKAVDRHTFDTDDGLCLDEDISIILEELPPVKPTRNKGKWIEVDTNMYTCSNCSHCFEIVPEVNSIHQFKCCPNCGAEMGSEETWVS